MTFDIRSNLTSLTVLEESRTHCTCTCPVCGGRSFKINLQTGAYKCWSNECPSKAIRDRISPKYPAFTYHKPSYHSPLRELVREVPLQSSELELSRVVDFIPQTQAQGRIYYYYSSVRRAERVQMAGKKKKVFPQFFDGNTWQYGTNGELWGAYFPVTRRTSGTLLCVEGEKSVHACLEAGYSAFTLASPCWGDKEAYSALQGMVEQHKLTHLILCADGDATGMLKARKVLRAAWKLGIPAGSVAAPELVDDGKDKMPGYDLADIFSDYPSFDLNHALRRVYAAGKAH